MSAGKYLNSGVLYTKVRVFWRRGTTIYQVEGVDGNSTNKVQACHR